MLRTSPSLPRVRLVSLAFGLALAFGCGGGGVGTETVRVSANPSTVAYGGTTRISWSAASSASFRSSNFGLTDDNYRGGSLTDTPGTTTTYEMSVRSENGNDVPGRATVTVPRISKGVLVAGDLSKAGPEQIGAFLRTQTTGTVVVGATIPAPSATYGVLVVSPTIVTSSGSAATVKA